MYVAAPRLSIVGPSSVAVCLLSTGNIMDIHNAARAGDLSALQDAIMRRDDVNSLNGVSWFVGM